MENSMNQEKTIERLRKRNMQLQAENDNLTVQLDNVKNQSKINEEKYRDLELLKSNWEEQIHDLQTLKEQYVNLLSALKEMQKIKK